MLNAKYAMPAQAQNGDLKEIGTLAAQISKDAKVRITGNGIMVIEGDQNFFLRFSNGVKKNIKDGTITQENMGHLVVYESNYQDDDGKDQVRLVLGLPQGFSGEAFDGAAFGAAITTKALTPKTVSLQGINLVELVA